MKINENTCIGEILDRNPDATDIFLNHGLNCLGCPGAQQESLKEAADGHGVDIGKLIKDLQQFLGE